MRERVRVEEREGDRGEQRGREVKRGGEREGDRGRDIKFVAEKIVFCN